MSINLYRLEDIKNSTDEEIKSSIKTSQFFWFNTLNQSKPIVLEVSDIEPNSSIINTNLYETNISNIISALRSGQAILFAETRQGFFKRLLFDLILESPTYRINTLLSAETLQDIFYLADWKDASADNNFDFLKSLFSYISGTPDGWSKFYAYSINANQNKLMLETENSLNSYREEINKAKGEQEISIRNKNDTSNELNRTNKISHRE